MTRAKLAQQSKLDMPDDFDGPAPKSQGQVPAAKPAAKPSGPRGEVAIEDFDAAPKAAPSGGQTSPTAAVQTIAAVKSMQAAIIGLADALIANPAFAMKESGRQVDSKESHLAGHDQFNKYLVNKYIKPQASNTSQGGAGFQNVDLDSPVRMGASTPLADNSTNLRNIAMTLRHVGSKAGGGEGKPDGIWGPRTHNAVKLMAVLAGGLSAFAKALGFDPKSYAEKDANELRSKIPDTAESIQDKAQFAEALTSHAKQITAMVGEFSSQVMNNPDFAPLMSQDEPMFKNENAKQEILSDQEQNFLRGNDGKLPGTNLTWQQVQSPEAFALWMKANGKGTDTASMTKEIDALIAGIAKASTSPLQGTR